MNIFRPENLHDITYFRMGYLVVVPLFDLAHQLPSDVITVPTHFSPPLLLYVLRLGRGI